MDRQWRGVLIMNTPCAVSIDERRHQQDCEDAERRADAVSDYALELVCGELSICKFENFADALAEVIEDESALARIHCAITFGRSESAGIMLRQAIEKILSARAEQMAISHVDSSCQKCFGRGCRKCDPPEPDYDD